MIVIEQMVAAKIARNAWHAAAIANGLRLGELKTDPERMERCRLYRLWRDAGEPPAVAFRNAIDGREPASLPFVQVRPKHR